MQIPYRKPGKFMSEKHDPIMSRAKLAQLQAKLERLKKARPETAAEVARLAELGDFSENAEYQLAKGKLRGINSTMLRLEQQIINAEVISVTNNSGMVQIGSRVTVEVNGKEKSFEILGSSETDPEKGIISYTSPLGAALMGASEGDVVDVKLANRVQQYKVIKIS